MPNLSEPISTLNFGTEADYRNAARKRGSLRDFVIGMTTEAPPESPHGSYRIPRYADKPINEIAADVMQFMPAGLTGHQIKLLDDIMGITRNAPISSKAKDSLKTLAKVIDQPKELIRMDPGELEPLIQIIYDPNLKKASGGLPIYLYQSTKGSPKSEALVEQLFNPVRMVAPPGLAKDVSHANMVLGPGAGSLTPMHEMGHYRSLYGSTPLVEQYLAWKYPDEVRAGLSSSRWVPSGKDRFGRFWEWGMRGRAGSSPPPIADSSIDEIDMMDWLMRDDEALAELIGIVRAEYADAGIKPAETLKTLLDDYLKPYGHELTLDEAIGIAPPYSNIKPEPYGNRFLEFLTDYGETYGPISRGEVPLYFRREMPFPTVGEYTHTPKAIIQRTPSQGR